MEGGEGEGKRERQTDRQSVKHKVVHIYCKDLENNSLIKAMYIQCTMCNHPTCHNQIHQGGMYLPHALPMINPRRACAERVTVVVSCVCMYVCMYVCPNTLFWQYAQLEV